MAYNETSWATSGTTSTVGQAGPTLYTHFGVGADQMSGLGAGVHYAIPFNNTIVGSGNNDIDFGTGTDPATTFTTANIDTQYASQIVPMMWYVPDNIYIDSVHSIVGADAANGDTLRLHLLSYAYTSGSTSTLSDGIVLASSSSDVTSAGNKQTYLSSFTVSSPSVASGRVILAFIRIDADNNSDYSLNITVKYHVN